MQFIIDSLSKSYSKKEVLKKVSFTFESGKIYGLLGRNGAGKTTLFNCLNGDIPRDGGDFWFSEAGARRAVRPDDIGYVLSTPTVPEFLTGREFLKFFLDINAASIPDPGRWTTTLATSALNRPTGTADEGLLPRDEEQDADAGQHRRPAAAPAAG